LDNLAKSYQENLLRIGSNLATFGGEKICLLETKDPTGNLNPFMSLGAMLKTGGTSGSNYVQQNKFEKERRKLKRPFKKSRKPCDNKVPAPALLLA
jgi:hypothetical protein